MATVTRFNIPEFLDANPGADPANPTEAQLDHWVDKLNITIAGLDNIIAFFNFTTPTIPNIQQVAQGANAAELLAHMQLITAARTQVILFQGLVMAEAGVLTRVRRRTIKVHQPTFDGKPEHARGFLAQLSTYQHLRAGDFPDDKTFIAWTLSCMEGTQVNPWRNSLLSRRATLLSQNLPLPAMMINYGVFQTEFEGKFLDPNEIETAGRALMSLRQKNMAREYAQEFDCLAEIAGQTGQLFLSDQFRRNLKEEVQEKILRQNFATLQALQIAAIEWDDTLSQFRRNRGRKTYGEKPPWVQQSQEPAITNGTPMDLDTMWMSPEEYKKRLGERRCFGCGKKGHFKKDCHVKVSGKDQKKQEKPAESLSTIKVGLPSVPEEVSSGEELD